ncbi:1-acyl-sn-glycerol-3-phosphate acyltransferase, partial [Gluconacetobacter sacchari]
MSARRTAPSQGFTRLDLSRADAEEKLPLPSGSRLSALLRATVRLIAIAFWVPSSVSFEALLLLVPGTAKIRWTRVIWGVLCRLLSMKIRLIGTRAGTVG